MVAELGLTPKGFFQFGLPLRFADPRIGQLATVQAGQLLARVPVTPPVAQRGVSAQVQRAF